MINRSFIFVVLITNLTVQKDLTSQYVEVEFVQDLVRLWRCLFKGFRTSQEQSTIQLCGDSQLDLGGSFSLASPSMLLTRSIFFEALVQNHNVPG